MRMQTGLLVAVALIGGVAVLCVTGARGGSNAAAVRIGVYDSRAVAVAYAASPFMKDQLQDMMKQRDAARTAGDQAKVKQLEEQGQAMQRKLHRQGFSEVPVDDLLAPVKDQLPRLAQEADVVAIVPRVTYSSEASVEVVDVTDRIVELYKPSEKTKQTVAELRKQPPVDLDQIDRMHGH